MAITVEWLDGFEHQTLNTALYGTITATTVTIATSGQRSGAAALQCSPTASAGAQVTKTFATAGRKKVFRFYMRVTTAPASGNVNVFRTSGALNLRLSSGRVLSASCDGTNFQNGATLTLNQWYCIELRIDTSANPWTLAWRVDGALQTAPANNAVAAADMTTVTLGTQGTAGPAATVQYDDYIYGTFSAGTEWFGAGKILAYKPTSDGTHSVGSATFRFTSNNGTNFTNMTNSTTTSNPVLQDWPVTADANAADGWIEKSAGTGADYIEEVFAAAASGDQALLVNGVMGIAAIRNDSGTQNNNCQLDLVDNGVEHTDWFNATIGSATTIYKTQVWALAQDGAAWLGGDMANLRLRFRASDINPVPRLKAAMIQVDYAAVFYTTLTGAVPSSGALAKQSNKAVAGIATPTGGGTPNMYFIDFQDATVENPLSDGGRWITGGTTGLDWSNPMVYTKTNISRNICKSAQSGGTSGFDDAIAILTGTWGADQTVQATISNPSSGATSSVQELSLLLRFSISAHDAHGYECLFAFNSNNMCAIVRWNGAFNDYTTLATDGVTSTLTDGDVLKATIKGNVITMYINGVQKLQFTDNTYSSGAPGLAADWVGSDTPTVNSDFGFAQYWAKDAVSTPIANPTVAASDTASSGTSIAQNITINPGDLVVVAVINANSGAPRTLTGVSDNGASGGNTYNPIAGATAVATADLKQEMYYSIATKSASTVTASYGANSSTYRGICVWKSAAFASPILDSGGVGKLDNGSGVGNDNTGAGLQLLGPSVTTLYQNELMFAFCSPVNHVDTNPRHRNEFKMAGALTGSGPAGCCAQPCSAGVHRPMWTGNTSGDTFAASVVAFAETQFSNKLLKRTGKPITGTTSATATLRGLAKKLLTGSLVSTAILNAVKVGGAVQQAIDGVLVATGTLTKKLLRSLTGAVPSTGALANRTNKPLAGSLVETGALTNRANKPLSGTVTEAGTLVGRANKALSGALVSTGSALKQMRTTLSGVLAETGTVTKLLSRALSGAVTETGALTNSARKALAGAVTSTGTIATFAKKLLTGSLVSTGDVFKTLARLLSGSTAGTGTLAGRANKLTSGTLVSSGTLTKRDQPSPLVGVLASVGTVTKQSTRYLSGALDSAGSVVKQTARLLTGNLVEVATVLGVKVAIQLLTASLTFSGSVQGLAQKVLTGTVTAIGTLTTVFGRLLTGSLTFTGSVFKRLAKLIRGALYFD